MSLMTRRTCLKNLALSTAGGVLTTASLPIHTFAAEPESQPTPTESEAAAIATIVRQLMKQYDAPGLSLAVARHGQLVYEMGFGYADRTTGERVTTSSLFRIASVSKPITSVAIFSLIEQGRVGLNDLVFGAGGILKFDYAARYLGSVNKITLPTGGTPAACPGP